MAEDDEWALSVENVAVQYGGLRALRGVTLQVRPGEVVGLVGDNGAGKSTLIKVMSGNQRPVSGTIRVNGTAHEFDGPRDATAAGIATVYQDLVQPTERSVVETFFLGREMVRGGWWGRLTGWLDTAAMAKFTQAKLKELRVKIPDMNARCGDLSGGQRQALSIARAAAWCDSVLLLDEPTSALGVEQHGEVLELVRAARDRGLGVVLISHQMPDIMSVCDRVVVLRLGSVVANLEKADLTADSLIGAITGAITTFPVDPTTGA